MFNLTCNIFLSDSFIQTMFPLLISYEKMPVSTSSSTFCRYWYCVSFSLLIIYLSFLSNAFNLLLIKNLSATITVFNIMSFLLKINQITRNTVTGILRNTPLQVKLRNTHGSIALFIESKFVFIGWE